MTNTVAPHDLKSEEALLGAILVSPGTVTKARIDVVPEDFYRETHGQVWEAAVRCSGNGGCDPVAVAAELKRRGIEASGHGVNGLDYLNVLANSVPAPGNAKAYAERVKETAELRKIRRFALQALDGVGREDKDAIARALDALGQRVLYVDVESGEVIETCPTCIQNEQIIEAKEHRERSLLSQISKLEGKAEKKAREHKHWDEIACAFDWWKLATGHYGMRFTVEEFNQALPRWKENNRGKGNALIADLKAIAGAAFDPHSKRMKNGRVQKYDSWEIIHRNQQKFAEFTDRAPGAEDSGEWKVWLVGQIEAAFK